MKNSHMALNHNARQTLRCLLGMREGPMSFMKNLLEKKKCITAHICLINFLYCQT